MIGKTVSHYKIVEKLGEGGMGVVYKAHDSTLDRFVALKFLPSEMTEDADLRSRFIQEARAASALDHPNIAVVHEIGELEDGTSFICMAYYEGETLRKKIDKGPLTVRESTEIALQICDGLQRAHDANIIHRDIKPANLIITPEGVVKIVDFGLAKLSGQAPTSDSGRLVGTTAYMSPEQIQGAPVDHRSDLFSLGVVMYEMLTGKRPFVGEHEAALLYSIVHDEPAAPSVIRGNLPAAFDKMILRLLRKDPRERHQHAAEIRSDLRLVNPATGSISTSRFEAFTKTLRSRKTVVALSLLAISVLVVVASSLYSHSSISLNSSDFVMVADFENNTNEKVFDHSLTEAVTVSLRQSSYLNLLPPERIMGALERMKLPKDQRLNDTTALAVAQREGALILLAGNISHIGTSFFISMKIVDVASGEVRKLMRSEVRNIEGVLPEMDAVCKELRERLGESLGQISASAMHLEEVTTPSLQALELHSRAIKLQASGKYQEAAILNEQAVRIDSLFTMAVAELSYIYRKLKNDSMALFYHRRVLPLINRVTDKERYYILSMYYGPAFELDFGKAFESVRQLVAQYPNSAEGFATLGWLSMYDGKTEAAIDAFRRSLVLDSTSYAGTIFGNWGYALALAGSGKSALEFYSKSKRLRPTYHVLSMYIAQAQWMSGDLDSAEETLRAILPVADVEEKLLAQAQLVSLYEFEGRLHDSRGECASAITTCRAEHRSSDESYFHYLMAELAAELSDWNTYAKEMRGAERLSVSPFFELPLIGSSYAQNGRQNAAIQIVKLITSAKSADPYFLKRRADYLHLVNGEILLGQHSTSKAMEEFRAVERVHGGDPIFLLAQWGIARSTRIQTDTASAFHAYRDLLGRRGEVVMAFLRSSWIGGFWTRHLWPDVDLAIARLALKTKNRELAEEHLRNCSLYWTQADSADQRAREAARLLTQLTKGR